VPLPPCVRQNEPVRAQVIVLAGPSGSGKSRLCHRLGLPYVNLDDFYKDGSDPTLPRLGMGVVDWDDPASWRHDVALATIEALCRDGEADVPVYDIARDGRVGHRRLSLDGSPYFVAEGIFAQEVVEECAERGLLADAICVRNHRVLTFWRRLTRDLRQRRKPPLVLLRRGLLLMLAEPRVVARAVALACVPLTPDEAYRRVHQTLLAPPVEQRTK
jgi:uridine kinase